MRTNMTLIVVLLGFAPGPWAQPATTTNRACAVTVPNGIQAGLSERQEWSHGNSRLSVGPFGLWPDGKIVFKPGGPGFRTRDGFLGMKFGWRRGVRGKLSVSGRRLDGAAPALVFQTNNGYGDFGFQASALIFPTPGCWEVTARLVDRDDSTLTFITEVVQTGEGPTLSH
jgi:hypothetical protein